MDLVYLFKVLLRRKWLVLAITLLAITAAVIFTRGQKKKYDSTAEIATGYTISDQLGPGSQTYNAYEVDVKFNNVIERMNSPQVVGLLSYKLLLHDLNNPSSAFRNPSDNNKYIAIRNATKYDNIRKILNEKLDSIQLLSSYDPTEKRIIELLKLYDYDFQSLNKNLSVYRLQHTDFIDIIFSSEKPNLSAYVVNMLIQQFLRSYYEVQSQRTDESIQAYNRLVNEKKQELENKQMALANLTINSTNSDDGGAGLLTTFQTQFASEKSNITTYQLQLEDVKNKLAAVGNPQTQDNSNADIISLQKEIGNLATQNMQNDGNNVVIENRIDSLRNLLKQKMAFSNTSSPAPIDNRQDLLKQQSDLNLKLKIANQNIDNYSRAINSLKANSRSTVAQEAIADALQKEVDQASKDYQEAKEKYNQALSNQKFPDNNFKQILMGQPAVDPEPSKRIMIIGLAGFAAFALTSLLILVLEYVDLSIKTPSHFLSLTNMSLIGILNFVNLKKITIDSIFEIAKEKPDNAVHYPFDKSADLKGIKPTYDFKASIGVSFANNKNDDESIFKYRETIKKLRYEIENSGGNIFLFTSTRSGEGKSTIIQSLAYSLSLMKKKVLIIDTNFAHNSLTLTFAAKPQLESYISRLSQFNPSDLIKISSPTSIPLTDIIGCEGGNYTPLEVFADDTFLKQLPQLIKADYYDYIFLEGAALNNFPDSKELIKYVDKVVSVFSADTAIKQPDKESIKFLNTLDNKKLLGAILNKVELENIEL